MDRRVNRETDCLHGSKPKIVRQYPQNLKKGYDINGVVSKESKLYVS